MNIRGKKSSVTMKQFVFNSIIGLMCIYIFVNYMYVPALQITYQTVDEVLICDTMTYVGYTFAKGSYIEQAKYYLLLIPILAVAIGCIESLAPKKVKIITNLVLSIAGSIITGFTWLDLSLQVKGEIFSRSEFYGTNPTVGWYLGIVFFILLAIYYLFGLLAMIPKKNKKVENNIEVDTKSEEIDTINDAKMINDDKE